jgi:acyl-coenzyme A synthetase/AMP-(fatty) acid ligase
MLQKAGVDEEALSWKEVIGKKTDPPQSKSGVKILPLIMYTSGTTGDRKGHCIPIEYDG